MWIVSVDIGNSGLRAARLEVAQHRIGPIHRIDWLLDAGNQRPQTGDRRYGPDNPSWLNELKSADLLFREEAETLWLISSVRRDALAILGDFIGGLAAHRAHVITRADVPLDVDVDFPDRVGIDRLLAASAAANYAAERPVVVIQAGSAVTVDLLRRDPGTGKDTFCGGAIVPGIPMMLRLLGQAADLLPQLNADDLMDELPHLPGRNTEQAMLCGASSALVGGVRHLVGRYRQANSASMPVIISGGDGARLSPFLSPPVMTVPHLVHRGILGIARAVSAT